MNNPSGMGIQFIDIGESDELFLDEYIKEVMKASADELNDISINKRSVG